LRDSSGLSDQDIHDFIDDRLAPAERARVAAYLAHHPEEEARIAAYRAQNSGLHALHDEVLAMPVPAAMREMIARHRAAARRRRGLLAVVLMLAALGAGWLVLGR
jgi:anti-sigma factor RsiW